MGVLSGGPEAKQGAIRGTEETKTPEECLLKAKEVIADFPSESLQVEGNVAMVEKGHFKGNGAVVLAVVSRKEEEAVVTDRLLGIYVREKGDELEWTIVVRSFPKDVLANMLQDGKWRKEDLRYVKELFSVADKEASESNMRAIPRYGWEEEDYWKKVGYLIVEWSKRVGREGSPDHHSDSYKAAARVVTPKDVLRHFGHRIEPSGVENILVLGTDLEIPGETETTMGITVPCFPPTVDTFLKRAVVGSDRIQGVVAAGIVISQTSSS